MKIFGIDFTSAPGRKKPITVAEGELKKENLTLHKVYFLVSFDEFEDFLKQKGPWIAGIDFPFGLPGAFLSTLGLPHDWQSYVQALTRRSKTEFEKKNQNLQIQTFFALQRAFTVYRHSSIGSKSFKADQRSGCEDVL